MTVSEDAKYDEVNPSLPRAMCVAGEGCSAGVATAKQQVFLSDPPLGSSTGAALSQNGTIIVWGKSLPGDNLPTDLTEPKKVI